MIDEMNRLSIAVELARVAVEHRRWVEANLALSNVERETGILLRLVLEENRKDLLRGRS